MTLKNRRLGFPVGLPVASVVLGSALLSACTTSPEIAATTESKAVTVASNNATQGAVFASPVQLMADGAPIATASPGYAAPAWQDVTGDGRADLVVGQFKDGLMGVFAQNADGSFAAGQWLQADGKDAVVPGIW